MKNTLIKQMWAQKKSNGWIFIELIIIFVVSWLVIDPIYVIEYQRKGIKEGFDPENLYVANIGLYSDMAPKYDSTKISREALNEDLIRLVNLTKTFPGIEAAAQIDGNLPWHGSYSGMGIDNPEDTSVNASTQILSYVRGTDFFKVMRFRSALDHRWESLDELEIPSNGIILSEDTKMILFKDKPAIGKPVNKGQNIVVGVMDMVKRAPSAQPKPCALFGGNSVRPSSFKYGNVSIAIRVKPGTSQQKFLNDFTEEMSSKLESGNLFFNGIQPYSALGDQYSSWDESDSTLQLRSILGGFYLLVIFLGVISTFWLRVETRKEEIGVRMALGSTGRKIRRRLLGESTLLVLFASAIGLIITGNIVYFKGLYSYRSSGLEMFWPVENAAAHFTIVSVITLMVLLVIVVVATAIPASRAAKINPVDALRDE